ncbi:pyrimidine reductase family protein [Microbacterium sp. STN6]|uniref:pyrimidine reductase family protein n=1 Tax=Microbacterium sp. STN6 TaxID=2995588 RepID=UPI002260D289|nr:pyrimidine reductase family protein [Microbacterium sp. STN6]MCX7523407.1 pyrimidine reductase family protein [Microbacterium sp. STN6]
MSEITRVWPTPAAGPATDDDLADWYDEQTAGEAWTRVNFVASLDGAATHQGRSAGLSDDADHRVFDILRRLCDVVVVGAGTVRIEGYGAMRVDAASARWRTEHGRHAQPTFALVSATLNLDPESPVFADAPVRPIVFTGAAAAADRRRALEAVADVVTCGDALVDTRAMITELVARGLGRIHCEGGPHLFGALVADGTVDELCLTLSPQLEGGTAKRITDGSQAAPLGMRLAHVLASADTLLLRYLRE